MQIYWCDSWEISRIPRKNSIKNCLDQTVQLRLQSRNISTYVNNFKIILSFSVHLLRTSPQIHAGKNSKWHSDKLSRESRYISLIHVRVNVEEHFLARRQARNFVVRQKLSATPTNSSTLSRKQNPSFGRGEGGVEHGRKSCWQSMGGGVWRRVDTLYFLCRDTVHENTGNRGAPIKGGRGISRQVTN